jgi:hypothetical protein
VAARVRFQVGSCRICGGQNDTEAGFLRVLPLPLPILISPVAPYSMTILSSTLYSFDIDSFVKQELKQEFLGKN